MKSDKAKIRLVYYHYPNGKGKGGDRKELELTIDADIAPRHSTDLDRIIPLIKTQVPFGDIDAAMMMGISRFNIDQKVAKERNKLNSANKGKKDKIEEENEDYEENQDDNEEGDNLETFGSMMAETGREMFRDLTASSTKKKTKKDKWVVVGTSTEEKEQSKVNTFGDNAIIAAFLLLNAIWWCIKLPFKILRILISFLK